MRTSIDNQLPKRHVNAIVPHCKLVDCTKPTIPYSNESPRRTISRYDLIFNSQTKSENSYRRLFWPIKIIEDGGRSSFIGKRPSFTLITTNDSMYPANYEYVVCSDPTVLETKLEYDKESGTIAPMVKQRFCSSSHQK